MSNVRPTPSGFRPPQMRQVGQPLCDGGDSFNLIANDPLVTAFTGVGGFFGPLTLFFDGEIDPATVVQGSTLIIDDGPGFGPYTFEVVGTRLIIHNSVGGGDDWHGDGVLLITCSAGIKKLTLGTELTQPAEVELTWSEL